jgi:hypothetical protein
MYFKLGLFIIVSAHRRSIARNHALLAMYTNQVSMM